MKRYFWNILIGFDQLLNAIIGGDPDETISSALGKAERVNALSPCQRCLVRILNRIDPGHCRDSIEEDEGGNAI